MDKILSKFKKTRINVNKSLNAIESENGKGDICKCQCVGNNCQCGTSNPNEREM